VLLEVFWGWLKWNEENVLKLEKKLKGLTVEKKLGEGKERFGRSRKTVDQNQLESVCVMDKSGLIQRYWLIPD